MFVEREREKRIIVMLVLFMRIIISLIIIGW